MPVHFPQPEPASSFGDLYDLIFGWLMPQDDDPSGIELLNVQGGSSGDDIQGDIPDTSFPTEAPDLEDTSQTGTVSITLEQPYTTNAAVEMSVEGVRFRLARIGVIENGQYSLLEAYKDTGIELSSLDTADKVQQAAAKLETAVTKTEPETVYDAVTDSQGKAVLSGIPAGVYLLYAANIADYELISPTLIAMPSYSETGQDMAWEIDVAPKHSPLPVLKITKTDTDGDAIVSDRTRIGIYSDPNCTKLISESGTDASASVLSALTYGTYYIKETSAPDGYSLNEKVFVVDFNSYRITVDGKTVEPDAKNMIYLEIEDEKTSHFTGEDSERPSTSVNNSYRPGTNSSTSTNRPPTAANTHAGAFAALGAVSLAAAGVFLATSNKRRKK